MAKAMKLEIKSSATTSPRSRRKEEMKAAVAADKQLQKFYNKLNKLGSSIESLIDATPYLGVPDPCDPWVPSTDKKKAMLSNPIEVLNDTVGETFEALPPDHFFKSGLSAFREGLANSVLTENAMAEGSGVVTEGVDVLPVVIELEVDAVVSSEGAGEAFVDLGADNWNSSARAVHPMEEIASEVKTIRKAVSHFLTKSCLPFLDNLTLRANGIVVTSDDCSVECSLASLINDDIEAYSPASLPDMIPSDIDDFEDCPSVVTELASLEDIEDDIEDDIQVAEVAECTKEDQVVEEENVQELKTAADRSVQDLASDDDQDYVMTEEPDSDEEDFVNLSDFDITDYH